MVVLAALMMMGSARAQDATQKQAMGTVTGRVVCADTQRPARFAGVLLYEVPKTVTPHTDPKSVKDALNSFTQSMGKMNYFQAKTDLDGAYSVDDVEPGLYYVFGITAGYVGPLSVVSTVMATGGDLSKPLPGVPTVQVTGGRTTTANVSLERGAAIGGTVVWDDGSPVSGAVVQAQLVKSVDLKQLPVEFKGLIIGSASTGLGGIMAITDDVGRFRISGQAPGDYIVQASIKTTGGISMSKGQLNFVKGILDKPLVVYAPAEMHKDKAETVTVHSGDERTDVVVTVALNSMHKVSGRVTALEDHHGINSGLVTLTDTSDKNLVRTAEVGDDGVFTLSYVPAGTYTLKATTVDDVEPTKDSKGHDSTRNVRSYDDGEVGVIVADHDMSGQDVELKQSAKVRTDDDESGAFMKLLSGGN